VSEEHSILTIKCQLAKWMFHQSPINLDWAWRKASI
jgi:hypothetical protein